MGPSSNRRDALARVVVWCAIFVLSSIAPLVFAQSFGFQYCAQNHAGASACFASEAAALSYMRQEPAPPVGRALLERKPVTTLALSNPTSIPFHVPLRPPSDYVGDYYVGHSPRGTRDCSTGQPTPPSLGVYRCADEPALQQHAWQSFPYYADPQWQVQWRNSYPSYPSSVSALADSDSSRWLVRATSNNPSATQRLFEFYSITSPLGSSPYNIFSVTKEDWWWCPPLFTGPCESYQGCYWPLVCSNAQTGALATIFKQADALVCVGNPCNPITGNKEARETDFQWGTHRIVRSYNSVRDFAALASMGETWTHNFAIRLAPTIPENSLPFIQDAENHIEQYTQVGTSSDQFTSKNNVGEVLSRTYVSGSIGWDARYTWILKRPDGEHQHFDIWGRLTAIRYPASPERDVVLYYCAQSDVSAGTCAIKGVLHSVTDALGRSITFDYLQAEYVDLGGVPTYAPARLVGIRDGQVERVNYVYDALGRLVEARYPNGMGEDVRTYHYGESTHVCKEADGSTSANCTPSAFPEHLTGITDESGTRYANYTYDAQGWATSSEHAGGAGRVELTYATSTRTDVRDASGAITQYNFPTSMFRKVGNTTKTGGGITQNVTRVHSSSLQVSYEIDAGGTRTDFAYDGYRESSRIEAVGLASQRTTSTAWNDTYNRRTGRDVRDAAGTLVSRSTVALNARGQTSAVCSIDPTDSTALAYVCGSQANAPSRVRQTSTAYCEQADVAGSGSTCPVLGLVKSIDGPRTDVSDVTTYTYRAADAANCASQPAQCTYRKGDLWKVTDPLGHVTEYLSDDASGRVTSMADTNGVTTDMEYHPRGWLTARKVRGTNSGTETDDAITRIDYDGVGQVVKVTQPDGAYLAYTYDAAHRLTDITDNAGNSIHYTLDAAGNRVKESTKDPGGVVKRSLARQVDTLGRINRQLRAPYADLADLNDPSAKKTTTTFDANGNVDTVTDPLGRVTDNDYDPLDRLIKTVSDKGTGRINAAVEYEYDARDNLIEVVDPKGLSTTYTYNGLNDLVQLSSPDTGVTTYTYDSAGNRATQTDARGITSTMSYDALNRLTGIAYPTSSEDVAFYYDQIQSECTTGETFALGRLTRMTDKSGETRYCYDRRGNVTRKVQVTSGTTLEVRYGYDLADRLSSITYPGGAVVTYTRDAQGRITGVAHQPSGGTVETVVSSVSYLPFGPVGTITFGNGRTLTKTYDKNYAIDAISTVPTNGLGLDFTVNDVGNITAVIGAATRNYTYDNLDRLTAAKDQNLALLEGFAYDATGNRSSKQLGSNPAESYTYPSTSHRLTQVGAVARSYDAVGNTTNDGTVTFTYDDRNRLSSAAGTSYVHNGRGERVAKGSTRFVFDEGGQYLSETGANATDYIWLDGTLIGLVRGGAVRYVEADHLGTPRNVVDPVGDEPIWSWPLESTSFGDHAANEDPDGDASAFSFALRYPGQYFDGETGLHYNYFRDYEPGTGRYVESDPIGLKGGPNSYSYANAAPVDRQDRWGLFAFKNCSTDQQDEVNAAMTQVGRDWKTCFGSGCTEPLPPTHITQQATANPNFPSLASAILEVECTGPNPEACASMLGSIHNSQGNRTPPFGTLTIFAGNPDCPNKARDCLNRTLFHELLHYLDTTRNQYSPGWNHDEIDPIVEKCVSCPLGAK